MKPSGDDAAGIGMRLRPRRSALNDISNVVPASASSNATTKVTGKRTRRSSELSQSNVDAGTAESKEELIDHGESSQGVSKTRRSSRSKKETEVKEQAQEISLSLPVKVRRISNSLVKVAKNADPAQCFEYLGDIYDYYHEVEEQFRASQYMGFQKDINPRMRAILIDWLVEVHHKFKLQPQTLWLSVNILDRYLGDNQVVRSKLQLVGVCSLLIACKFEEIYPPEVRDCVYITDYAYEREEVLEMESRILQAINFQISVPTCYHFMTRYLNLINAQDRSRFLTAFYSERNLQEYDSLSIPPSKLAAAAIYAALRQQVTQGKLGSSPSDTADSKIVWPLSLEQETGLQEADLIPIARTMIQHVAEEPVTASRRVLLAAKKKYDHEKFQNVSKLPLPVFE